MKSITKMVLKSMISKCLSAKDTKNFHLTTCKTHKNTFNIFSHLCSSMKKPTTYLIQQMLFTTSRFINWNVWDVEALNLSPQSSVSWSYQWEDQPRMNLCLLNRSNKKRLQISNLIKNNNLMSRNKLKYQNCNWKILSTIPLSRSACIFYSLQTQLNYFVLNARTICSLLINIILKNFQNICWCMYRDLCCKIGFLKNSMLSSSQKLLMISRISSTQDWE